MREAKHGKELLTENGSYTRTHSHTNIHKRKKGKKSKTRRLGRERKGGHGFTYLTSNVELTTSSVHTAEHGSTKVSIIDKLHTGKKKCPSFSCILAKISYGINHRDFKEL